MKREWSRRSRLLLVLGIYLTSVVWVTVYFRYRYVRQSLLSVGNASEYLGAVTLQTFLVNLPMIVALSVSFCLLGRDTAEKLSLQVRTKSAKIIVTVLAVVYVFQLVSWLGLSDDKITVAFQWLYYLLAVAFLEEFEFRALFPAILGEKFSPPVRWILPNALFALAHSVLMVVTGMEFSQIMVNTLNNFLGYVLVGVFLEWCRRKTQSLWVGVLIHALMDFPGSVV